MKKAIIFALALTLFLAAPALAAPQGDLQSLSMEGIGTSLIPGGINSAHAVGAEQMKNMETQYDLTSSDTDGSHYARLIVYKDTRNLGPVLALVDMVEFKPELVAMMSDLGRDLVSKKLEEQGAKLIEWLPVQKVLVQKHNGVLLGVRLTLNERLPIPMFATVAVYTENGGLRALALMCPDSDRLYWQPVFKQIFASLKKG